MRFLVLVTLALSLTACSDNADSNQCACTVSVSVNDASASLALACGAQGCVSGLSFGCDNDDVVSLGVCGLDLATPPVKNDAGMSICLVPRADCTGATLPCCSTDAGTAPSCDPESLLCCVVTGGTCTTASDCCDGHTCIELGGKTVCGS